jgi:[acyl-carrier-protein] S-malonyltransferase
MKFAFAFPGQGSQSVGMMQAYSGLPEIEATFAQASEVLGEDLWQMAEHGPVELLGDTTRTQPLMLTAGIALYRAWIARGGPQPALMAGHSLGEYTALVAARALDFKDAVALVRFRATYMQEAVPPGSGAIAAILGLDDDAVRAVCVEASHANEVVEAANYNSPAQVVVAGSRAAVERAMDLAKSKGAKRAVLLPMSVPSHCSLMRPVAAPLRTRLEEINLRLPEVAVLHNADVQVAHNLEAMRDVMVRQLSSPVRWVETVQSMVKQRCNAVIECGPGKVLYGLNKRIAADATHLSLSDAAAFEAALDTIRQGQG